MGIMNSKRDVQRWADEQISAADGSGLTEDQLREAVDELTDKVCDEADDIDLEWGEDWSGLLSDLLLEDIVDAILDV